MTQPRVKFGILGCGAIAAFHAKGIAECPSAELSAVCDVDIARAKDFAHRHEVEKAYSDIREMAAFAEVDAVCICTPSGLHLAPILVCLDSGKHVLAEKPLEITTERIDRIADAASRANAKVGAIFQIRYSPDVQKVKKALEDRALGKLLIADAYMKYYRTPEYYASAGWRGSWKIDGGGALMNQGIHWVDLLLWLVGEAKTVTGYCHTLSRKIEVEDTAHAIVQFQNGAAGVIESTTCAYPGFPTRIEIHGERGSICLEDDKIERWEIEGDSRKVEGMESDERGHSDPKAISARGHILQIQDFVRAILEDGNPGIDIAEARRSVACIEAIYRSSRERIPVVVSPCEKGMA